MNGRAILFDALTTREGTNLDFDIWYMSHYLPAMSGVAHWLGVRRYGSPALGAYLAVFEAGEPPASLATQPLTHDAVTKVERYLARHIGEQTAEGADPDILEADYLYPVIFNVPPERQSEFERWYVEEHLDILLSCPYWQMCRRFKVIDPAPGAPTHIALHYLTDLRALESEARTRARSTPWRQRFAAESWFRGDYRVYHRHARRLVRTAPFR
jgi:hypothetical protein